MNSKLESEAFQKEIETIETWFNSPRFKYINRPYDAKKVASFRGTLHVESSGKYPSKKLYSLLRTSFEKRKYSHTFGALDPVQVVQMAKYLDTIYVSGWQSSSTASSSNEPGPDFADYPANTVPLKVDQLFRAQLLQDRRQKEERSRMSPKELEENPKIDYLKPIVADGDTGFGGITSVMKLVKMMIEAGAAGIHIEDQKCGAKKCGHLGGKVLIPIREMCNRMSAARLQADIMGCETVLIARTDAEAAPFLESNIDPRDHPFIAGSVNPDLGTYNDAIDKEEWLKFAKLCRYTDAIANEMIKSKTKEEIINKWRNDSMNLSHDDAKKLAESLGFGHVYWNWESPRTSEGFFRVIGGEDYSAIRAISYSDCSDLVWMETSSPNVEQVKYFSSLVHEKKPNQMLAYNLSPSFNWDAAGMNDQQIQNFQKELGNLGFCWHFITLCGFHANSIMIDNVAKAYSGPKGVLAYVEMVQRKERDLKIETLTHQRWSGAFLMDQMMNTATNNQSSTSSSSGSTESQFKSKL